MSLSNNSSLENGANIEYTILDILNQDCLNHIFSYVQLHDIVRSERVSKYWRHVVSVYMGRKRTLIAKPWKKNMSRTELQGLLWRHGEALTRLEITHIIQTDTNRKLVTSVDICPNLKELEIYRNKVAHLHHLFRGCQNLRSISLSNCIGTDSFLKKCLNVCSIEGLTLHFDDSQGCFLIDTNLESLKHLELCNCNYLDTFWFSKIRTLSNLATLNINNCYFNCKSYLKLWQKLKEFTRLQELSLCGCVIFVNSGELGHSHQANVEQFRYAFSKLSLLKHLYLKDNFFVTDEVLFQIAMSCKLLESLDLSFSYPPKQSFQLSSDDGVKALCTSCKYLKVLNLTRRRELSVRGVVDAVSQASSLERLIVRYLDELDTVSLAGILHACTSLRHLDIQCCSVTPELMYIAEDELKVHPRPLVLLISTDVYQRFKNWTIPKHSLLTISIGDTKKTI